MHASDPSSVLLAGRAAAAAFLVGLVQPRKGALAARVGPLRQLARCPIEGAADLLVATLDADDPSGDDASFAQAVAHAERHASALAVVVASLEAHALVETVTALPRDRRSLGSRTDPYAQALRWAAHRASGPRAAAARPERIASLVQAAEAAGLAFVDFPAPKLPTSSTTPTDRAVLRATLSGALALPLLFARPAARAKSRLRESRVADTFVCARDATVLADGPALVVAALDELRAPQATDAGADGIAFKTLLRNARHRAGPARTSSSDADTFARVLLQLWAEERLDLFVGPRAQLELTDFDARPR